MVSLGSLSWVAEVAGASSAKREAEGVGDAMRETNNAAEEAAEAMEATDSANRDASHGMNQTRRQGGGLAGVLTLLTGSTMLLLGALGPVGAAIKMIAGLLMGAFGVKALALAAVVAGLAKAFRSNFGDIQGIAVGASQTVQEHMTRAAEVAGPVWSRFASDASTLWDAHAEDIAARTIQLTTSIISAFRRMFMWTLPGFLGFLVDLDELLRTHLAPMALYVELIVMDMMGWFNWLAEQGTMVWGMFGSSILSIVEFNLTAIYETALILLDAFLTLNNTTLAIIARDWEAAWGHITGFYERTAERIGNIGNSLVNAVETTINDVGHALRTFANGTRDFGRTMIENIVTGVQQRAHRLENEIESMLDDVRAYFPFSPAEIGPLTDLRESGRALVDEIVAGIRDNADAIEDEVMKAMGDARDYLPFSPAKVGPMADINESGGGLVDTVAENVEQKAPRLTGAVSSVVDDARSEMNVSDGATNGIMGTTESTKNAREGKSVETSNASSDDGDVILKIERQIIEIGDQMLDVRDLDPQTLRKLAELISDEQGKELQNVLTS